MLCPTRYAFTKGYRDKYGKPGKITFPLFTFSQVKNRLFMVHKRFFKQNFITGVLKSYSTPVKRKVYRIALHQMTEAMPPLSRKWNSQNGSTHQKERGRYMYTHTRCPFL